MHWLVVRGGALGDFLLTLPALEAVRSLASRVTLVATPRYARLRPDLYDRLVDLRGPEALWLFGGGPAPAPLPDAALVYTPTVDATLRALGVRDILGTTPRPPPGLHAVAHLWAPLADRVAGPPPLPRLPAEGLAAPPLPHPRPVVLAPGAGSPDKQWPHFAAVAEGLIEAAIPFVWVLGRDEAPPAALPGPVLPDLELGALVALAARCAVWLGNDTGTTHLAAAAGACTLALFGPTDPACWAPCGAQILPFELSPKSVLARVLIANAISCPRGVVHPETMD